MSKIEIKQNITRLKDHSYIKNFFNFIIEGIRRYEPIKFDKTSKKYVMTVWEF